MMLNSETFNDRYGREISHSTSNNIKHINRYPSLTDHN